MKLSTLCAAAAFALLAVQASAGTVTVTVMGTLTSDPGNQFGPLGSAISIVYEFDTSVGFSGGGIVSTVSGGSVHGTPSPSLGAMLVTPVQTVNFTGAYNAQLYAFNDGTHSESFQMVRDNDFKYVSADMAPQFSLDIPARSSCRSLTRARSPPPIRIHAAAAASSTARRLHFMRTV